MKEYNDLGAARKRRQKRGRDISRFIMLILIISLVFIITQQNEKVEAMEDQICTLTILLTDERSEDSEPVAEPEYISIGDFKIYHYCPCKDCCGKEDWITASGVLAQENRTIATDPLIIPLGTKVYIDGQEYIAEDTGSGIKGNKIDLFVNSHEEAVNRGVLTREVSIKK